MPAATGQISPPIENPEVGLPDSLTVGSQVSGEVLLTLIGTFADGTVQMVYQSLVNVEAGGYVPPAVETPYPVRPTVVATQKPPTAGTTLPAGDPSGGDTETSEDIWTKNGFTPNPKRVISWDSVSVGSKPENGMVYYDADSAYLCFI